MPLALFCRVAGGYSVLDHQRYMLFGVSIFALGLFRWLRSFRLSALSALVGSLVISVSFKMTDILRFPNAVHTAAWYPWLLFAVTRLLQSPSCRSATRWGLLFGSALICLITAGYPYYVYYFPFLFVPYVLTLLLPPMRRLFGFPALPNVGRALLVLAVACLAAVLLTLPYSGSVLSLMNETVDRTDRPNLEYATSHVFNLQDTIGSLLYPPAAQAEGWYFFSITGLLVILGYFAAPGRDTALEGGRSKRFWYLRSGVKWAFLAWFIFISLVTYGRHSALFLFFWHHLPGFNRLRVWGRLNVVLLPPLALLLAISYDYLDRVISFRKRHAARLRHLMVVVAALYVLVAVAQVSLLVFKRFNTYWTSYFQSTFPHELLFIALGGLGALSLLAVLIWIESSGRRPSAVRRIPMMGLVVVLCGIEMAHLGLFMWSGRVRATGRDPLHVDRLDRESFHVPRIDQTGTISTSAAFSVGIIPNWYFERYVGFRRLYEEPGAVGRLLGEMDGRKLYFTRRIEHSRVSAFLDDADSLGIAPEVLDYTGDRLTLNLATAASGYLSFIDNWQAGWEARIDGQEVPIELLFGTFKSVRVSAGVHRVTFEYCPRLLRWSDNQEKANFPRYG